MAMGKMRTANGGPITIRRQTVEVFVGLSAAARRLGCSATQVKRHVSGEQPSQRLAQRMAEKGVEVAV